LAINELKSAPKAKSIKKIYFPGERLYLKRQNNLNKNNLRVSKKLKSELLNLLNN
jgi:LDH2 family malate/lactate/ureidoglycolate dehydrogenase